MTVNVGLLVVLAALTMVADADAVADVVARACNLLMVLLFLCSCAFRPLLSLICSFLTFSSFGFHFLNGDKEKEGEKYFLLFSSLLLW